MLPDSPALDMIGIFDVHDGIPCYVILTTAANGSMREIHDRMPLVLEAVFTVFIFEYGAD